MQKVNISLHPTQNGFGQRVGDLLLQRLPDSLAAWLSGPTIRDTTPATSGNRYIRLQMVAP